MILSSYILHGKEKNRNMDITKIEEKEDSHSLVKRYTVIFLFSKCLIYVDIFILDQYRFIIEFTLSYHCFLEFYSLASKIE